MVWFGWKRNSFKVCGISVLKARVRKGRLCVTVLNIPVFYKKTPLSVLTQEIRENKNFDARSFDERIVRFAPEIKVENVSPASNRIAFVATTLYDKGGHSKVLYEVQDSLKDSYEECLFLINKNTSYKDAPNTLKEIEKFSQVRGIDSNVLFFKKNAVELFNQINAFRPKVLFVFIHPDDILGAAVLSMLKKHTSVKILYCPHASFLPNLGFGFADLSWEASPMLLYITQKLRKFTKTHLCPMLCKKVSDTPDFPASRIDAKRKEIGIKEGEFCTMSGAAAYKLFADGQSEYFEMVKRLLERNPTVKHVILSDFKDNQRTMIKKIFGQSEAQNRLIILPFSNEYELIFKCADVFIDSFPVSSALTMIDLMRLQVPYVVKINRENSLYSFHEYQKSGFQYMYDNSTDMLNGIEKLLADTQERKRIVDENLIFYKENYDKDIVKNRLITLIENTNDWERFYTPVNPSRTYNFKDIDV